VVDVVATRVIVPENACVPVNVCPASIASVLLVVGNVVVMPLVATILRLASACTMSALGIVWASVSTARDGID
jgi:hypothetical protein